MQILISLCGVAALIGIACLLSSNRSAINKRTIGVALLLQIGIAAFMLYLPAGRDFLATVVQGVSAVLKYGDEGTKLIFGEKTMEMVGFSVALNVLPIVIFFSALMSVFYYYGVMQWIIALLGGWLHKLLGTSQTESMSAVSNIFIGHTEAPLVVRPYLERMSNSELFAVMTGGCATIAGAIMFAYARLGVDLNYMITASFMAAPGGLLMAKLIMPETEQTTGEFDAKNIADEDRAANVFDAIGNGAATGLKLALNIGAMLLAFVSIIYLLNGMLGAVSSWFGYDGLTFQLILGWILAPLAFLIGVPWEEAATAGSMIGQKLILNEFFAYLSLVEIQDTLSERTVVITTFALCGFANLAAIAILLGGLGSVVPSRRMDIARLGLRAVIAGTLANLMNAALAGIFIAL